MTAGQMALLAGLFVAPALLLRLGGALRRRSRVGKGVFWGGVAGHSLGMAVTMVIMLFPPVVWTGGAPWREAVVYGALASGALLGAALGALLSGRRTHGG